MLDGYVDVNDNLICGVYNWDYCFDSGVLEYENLEVLLKFQVWIENGEVLVDVDEIIVWGYVNLQFYQCDQYFGLYQDLSYGEYEEFYNGLIQ